MNCFTFAIILFFVIQLECMQSIEIKNGVQVGVEELLKGIRQLDNQSLATVAGEVTRLLSKRTAQIPADQEVELLKKIKAVIPPAIRRRQKQLYTKLQLETLTPKEREELLLLNHLLEEKSAERIILLGELAKLRGVPVQQLADELKTGREHEASA